MDYLQYLEKVKILSFPICFKPCYKWITFNTEGTKVFGFGSDKVLGFKPCYKWITFNTISIIEEVTYYKSKSVLNLVINGLPSILKRRQQMGLYLKEF